MVVFAILYVCMHNAVLYRSVIIGRFRRDAGTHKYIGVRGKQSNKPSFLKVQMPIISFLESLSESAKHLILFGVASFFFLKKNHVGSAYHQARHGGRYVQYIIHIPNLPFVKVVPPIDFLSLPFLLHRRPHYLPIHP
jgi:hypothetical protein